MSRLPSLPALKRKCWKLVSEYVRRKDAANGIATCYTCGYMGRWQDLQAGHFVPGRSGAVLLNLEAIRVQCPRCNIWKSGNYQVFTLRMLDEVGRAKVDELLALRYTAKKWSRSELEALQADLTAKLKEIE